MKSVVLGLSIIEPNKRMLIRDREVNKFPEWKRDFCFSFFNYTLIISVDNNKNLFLLN